MEITIPDGIMTRIQSGSKLQLDTCGKFFCARLTGEYPNIGDGSSRDGFQTALDRLDSQLSLDLEGGEA